MWKVPLKWCHASFSCSVTGGVPILWFTQTGWLLICLLSTTACQFYMSIVHSVAPSSRRDNTKFQRLSGIKNTEYIALGKVILFNGYLRNYQDCLTLDLPNVRRQTLHSMWNRFGIKFWSFLGCLVKIVILRITKTNFLVGQLWTAACVGQLRSAAAACAAAVACAEAAACASTRLKFLRAAIELRFYSEWSMIAKHDHKILDDRVIAAYYIVLAK
jgi:hypothetical protein